MTPGSVAWLDERRAGGKPVPADTLILLALLVILAAALVGCKEQSRPPDVSATVRLTVYAPWSMEKRLRRAFEKFTLKHPEVVFQLETGTPGSLVNRMKAGDRPDVYVSMGPVGIEVLTGMGIVRQGSAREILRQRLILIRSEAMKDTVTGIESLAKPEVRKVGVARPSLSAGTFTRRALKKVGILEIVEAKAQISPLRSYMKGEVDAAIVLGECCYDEDLALGKVVPRRGMHVVAPLPETLCPAFAVIAVGITGSAPADAGDAFIHFLTGPEAQLILRRRGPGACPICDGEDCLRPTSSPVAWPAKATDPQHDPD